MRKRYTKFVNLSNLSCRPKKSDLEEAVLKQVLKSAKAFENASIDQRAFLRYRANENNVDLKKYVTEVRSEMDKDEKDDDQGTYN